MFPCTRAHPRRKQAKLLRRERRYHGAYRSALTETQDCSHESPRQSLISIHMSQFEPFNRHRLNFSSDGMLDQLRQFKEGLAQFIISEIVLGKLHAHLTLRGERGRTSLSERAPRVGFSTPKVQGCRAPKTVRFERTGACSYAAFCRCNSAA